MDVQAFSEWLEGQPVSGKIRALVLIYSRLTINARQLFLPETAGKEKRVLEILHGLNEAHHTIANWLCDYAWDETKAFPVHDLGQQLLEIEKRYRLEGFLTPAVEYIRTHGPVRRTKEGGPRA
jgi:hypothetical protein